MIYELRVYTVVPGRMPEVLARFSNHTTKIWERLGIKPVAFLTPVVAADSNELTYLIEWESMAEREAKWDTFVRDPEWVVARDASEERGPIVASMANSFLRLAAFSPAL